MNTYIRKLDEFNRIVIPAELQRQFELKNDDTLCLTLLNDRIIVTPEIQRCPICKGALDNDQYGICEPYARLVINH